MDYEGADIGEPIPSAGRLRASDRPIITPDLVFEHQLQQYLLNAMMEQMKINELTLTSLDVAKNRMVRIEVSETETGGIKAVRQS